RWPWWPARPPAWPRSRRWNGTAGWPATGTCPPPRPTCCAGSAATPRPPPPTAPPSSWPTTPPSAPSWPTASPTSPSLTYAQSRPPDRCRTRVTDDLPGIRWPHHPLPGSLTPLPARVRDGLTACWLLVWLPDGTWNTEDADPGARYDRLAVSCRIRLAMGQCG